MVEKVEGKEGVDWGLRRKARACDVGLGDEIRLEENQDSRKAKEIGWMLV